MVRSKTRFFTIGGVLCASSFSACAQDVADVAVLPLNVEAVAITSTQTCPLQGPPNLVGYELQDAMRLIDRPDAIISRASLPLEESVLSKVAQDEISLPISKTYCQIGVSRAVIDMTYPVKDDAVSHITIRAIYNWSTTEDVAGWQISELGQKHICARSQDPETKLCR